MTANKLAFLRVGGLALGLALVAAMSEAESNEAASLDQARAMAAESGRPILLEFVHDD